MHNLKFNYSANIHRPIKLTRGTPSVVKVILLDDVLLLTLISSDTKEEFNEVIKSKTNNSSIHQILIPT